MRQCVAGLRTRLSALKPAPLRREPSGTNYTMGNQGPEICWPDVPSGRSFRPLEIHVIIRRHRQSLKTALHSPTDHSMRDQHAGVKLYVFGKCLHLSQQAIKGFARSVGKRQVRRLALRGRREAHGLLPRPAEEACPQETHEPCELLVMLSAGLLPCRLHPHWRVAPTRAREALGGITPHTDSHLLPIALLVHHRCGLLRGGSGAHLA